MWSEKLSWPIWMYFSKGPQLQTCIKLYKMPGFNIRSQCNNNNWVLSCSTQKVWRKLLKSYWGWTSLNVWILNLKPSALCFKPLVHSFIYILLNLHYWKSCCFGYSQLLFTLCHCVTPLMYRHRLDYLNTEEKVWVWWFFILWQKFSSEHIIVQGVISSYLNNVIWIVYIPTRYH